MTPGMFRTALLVLALLVTPACTTSGGLYADSYSYERVRAIPAGATLDEVMRQLGGYSFKSGFRYTWIQHRSQSTGLRVTEVSMYFDANGRMTGHAGYDRDYY